PGAGRARKRAPLALDLCGIAKGFGVDELARCLEQFGVDSYLVSIDGEVRAGAPKPDGSPWNVAIEAPDRAVREATAVLGLSGGAVATSGDYRHWRQVDGRIVSHTVDPRTDQPVAGRVASVTVLAPDCMHADAWATALMVLGENEGPALAAARGVDALFILRSDGGFERLGTGVFG
ncbi:FAD:protein FMN transferase, partial [Devosia sp.]|uniref:FAD:protein FMN transferase n=1 Tax=Devosia sp. TaxID=1871048 RepID=UPI002EE6D7C6